LIQPQFEWGSRDHRLIFHPDFDFSQRDFLILNTVVTVAQTVDFERGRLAMMMVLDGPGNYDGFEVAWPTRGGDTIRTGFSPYKTGVASSIPMEDIMRFREAHVLNAAGDTATSVLLRYFKQEEATRVIQRPTFREFLRPEAFLAGEVNPLVAVIQDLDPFGAVSLQCQWHVAGSVGELLDGEETSPELDASLNLYRCTNRLRLPGDAKVGGVAPRVTLHLVQEGR
jgi:hypothetical protein